MTIWENYAPDSITPGSNSRPDFVGWSGIAPITFFIEHAIGVKADAPNNTIEWVIQSEDRVGIEDFWFGENTVDMICGKADKKGRREVRVTGKDRPFDLVIRYGDKLVEKKILRGKQVRMVI
ncbi:MAG: hypothetical protein AAF519_03920 [Bacteroidota bacterium]